MSDGVSRGFRVQIVLSLPGGILGGGAVLSVVLPGGRSGRLGSGGGVFGSGRSGRVAGSRGMRSDAGRGAVSGAEPDAGTGAGAGAGKGTRPPSIPPRPAIPSRPGMLCLSVEAVGRRAGIDIHDSASEVK